MPPSPAKAPSGYASIMVPMGGDGEVKNRAKLAIALADRFSSRIIGIAAHPIVSPLYFEAPVTGIASAIEIQERVATREIAAAEAVFRDIVATRKCVEWRHAHGFPTDFVLEHARAADLIVASRPRRAEGAHDLMGLVAGDLVMSAGRPVLFVPPGVDYLVAKSVVIGWKDTREARRAVVDALPLLKKAEHVAVVSVDTGDRGANDVAAWLACHGVGAPVARHIQSTGSAADELLKVSDKETADLVVCGAYGHSRTREWALGGVTRDLLDHARICCLMSH